MTEEVDTTIPSGAHYVDQDPTTKLPALDMAAFEALVEKCRQANLRCDAAAEALSRADAHYQAAEGAMHRARYDLHEFVKSLVEAAGK